MCATIANRGRRYQCLVWGVQNDVSLPHHTLNEAYVKVHCKPKTEKLYRTAIDRHIVPALGTMAVKDVHSKDVIALHDRLRNTPSMANHVVAMLSKMFSLADTSLCSVSET